MSPQTQVLLGQGCFLTRVTCLSLRKLCPWHLPLGSEVGGHRAFLQGFVLRQGLLYPGWPQTHYVANEDLELLILWPPPPECWDDRCASPTWLMRWRTSNQAFCMPDRHVLHDWVTGRLCNCYFQSSPLLYSGYRRLLSETAAGTSESSLSILLFRFLVTVTESCY